MFITLDKSSDPASVTDSQYKTTYHHTLFNSEPKKILQR